MLIIYNSKLGRQLASYLRNKYFHKLLVLYEIERNNDLFLNNTTIATSRKQTSKPKYHLKSFVPFVLLIIFSIFLTDLNSKSIFTKYQLDTDNLEQLLKNEKTHRYRLTFGRSVFHLIVCCSRLLGTSLKYDSRT